MRPSPRRMLHLQPRDSAGCQYLALVTLLTAAGAALSMSGGLAAWLAGQCLLAFALLQWFVVLHEAGHRTLFRTAFLNRVAGHVASVFALIPFHSWMRIHARHHFYTGWQDLDATTALLVPRRLRAVERLIVDAAWAACLPLFSVLYRVQNFWNLPRVARYLSRPGEMRPVMVNAVLLLVLYALLIAAWPGTVLRLAGLSLLLSLAMQDIILLSQHTHMPRNLSDGQPVRPYPPQEQEPFTRSLLLPSWMSRLLLRFDFHELHHLYVRVPGYDLHRIGYRPANEVHWFAWLCAAKRLRGTQFLFGNRDETGFRQ